MILRWLLKELCLGLASLGIAREGGGIPIKATSEYQSSEQEPEKLSQQV